MLKKTKEKKRRGYKLKSGEYRWKPWTGAKCPNVKCRSRKRCYSPSLPGSFSFHTVECLECGHIQHMDSHFRPVRPPEGWTRNSEGRWVSPEQQAKERERGRVMAVSKKKSKKSKKSAKSRKSKKSKKKTGEGVRQVVYFSAENKAVYEATKVYAAENEQSFASVVVEALNAHLELE